MYVNLNRPFTGNFTFLKNCISLGLWDIYIYIYIYIYYKVSNVLQCIVDSFRQVCPILDVRERELSHRSVCWSYVETCRMKYRRCYGSIFSCKRFFDRDIFGFIFCQHLVPIVAMIERLDGNCQLLACVAWCLLSTLVASVAWCWLWTLRRLL